MERGTKRERPEQTFERRERPRVTPQERRYDFIRAEITQNPKENCFGVGSEKSDKVFRIGDFLGSGIAGSVFDMHMHVEDINIHLAVKMFFTTTSQPRHQVTMDEPRIAKILSDAVLEGKARHFLLFYGYVECDMYDIPEGLLQVDRAVQLERWMKTALKYIKGPPDLIKALKESDMMTIKRESPRLPFKLFRGTADDMFIRKLKHDLGVSDDYTIEMVPKPEKIPVRMMVMEKALMTLKTYLMDPMTTSKEAHNIFRQIILAANEFVSITSHYHDDLHINNMMVTKRNGETRLVFIDFGSIISLEVSPTLSPMEGVRKMLLRSSRSIHNSSHDFKYQPELRKTVWDFYQNIRQRQYRFKSVDVFLEVWDSIAAVTLNNSTYRIEKLEEDVASLLF